MPYSVCNNIIVLARRTSNQFNTTLNAGLNFVFFRIQKIAVSRLMAALITMSNITILAMRVFVIADADYNTKDNIRAVTTLWSMVTDCVDAIVMQIISEPLIWSCRLCPESHKKGDLSICFRSTLWLMELALYISATAYIMSALYR